MQIPSSHIIVHTKELNLPTKEQIMDSIIRSFLAQEDQIMHLKKNKTAEIPDKSYSMLLEDYTKSTIQKI